MRCLPLITAVLLFGCHTSLAQVSTMGTTAMGLPSTPGAIVSSPLNGPSPFSTATQPGVPDTTLAAVQPASDRDGRHGHNDAVGFRCSGDPATNAQLFHANNCDCPSDFFATAGNISRERHCRFDRPSAAATSLTVPATAIIVGSACADVIDSAERRHHVDASEPSHDCVIVDDDAVDDARRYAGNHSGANRPLDHRERLADDAAW
jgi:hypothetical protein